MCPMPPIYTPLGRDGNLFQKKLLNIITLYRRMDLNQNQIAFLKKRIRVDRRGDRCARLLHH